MTEILVQIAALCWPILVLIDEDVFAAIDWPFWGNLAHLMSLQFYIYLKANIKTSSLELF